ncbi:MAG: F0F1 ATP synthase subunit delta [Ruminococcaceae bacterium]|nr:F0F1 ATP synthase subunit delta [Oscillospiraceae bacterium]
MKRVIITATPAMSEETYKIICGKIENKYGESFEFSRVDDASIIGGFILNIENKIYDLSTRTRLDEIGNHILN